MTEWEEREMSKNTLQQLSRKEKRNLISRWEKEDGICKFKKRDFIKGRDRAHL